MIASNEFEEAWIDEGINSFYEMKVMEAHYRYMFQLFGLRASPFDLNRLQQGDGRYSDAVVQPSWSYRTGSSYALNSYSRPAVTLSHLENLMGKPVFARAMRRFFQTWRFRHPSTEDFERIMREEAGTDVSWFLGQALHTDRGLDYSVRSATSRRQRSPRGWFWDDDHRRTLLGVADRHGDGGDGPGGDPAEAELDDAEDDEEGDYRTEVTVERRGELVHPVTVELVFDDGEKARYQWDGRSRWTRYVEVRPAKLVSAVVDPDHLLALDVDPLNNSIRLEPDHRPAFKMVSHLVFWLQNLFELTSTLG
jgi:aminopeptidase N